MGKAEKHLNRILKELNAAAEFFEGLGLDTQRDELDSAADLVESARDTAGRLRELRKRD